MFCPRCRSANADGAPFCAACGSPLSNAASRGSLRRGLAITSLVLGILSIPTLGLLGLGALLAIVLGIVALVKAKNSPGEYGGKGLAIGGIVCGGLSVLIVIPVGIIAAIAIPNMLRARMAANESAAIGDLRMLISAEATYQSVTGSYGTLQCLSQPAECDPKAGSMSMLDPSMASPLPRHGYELRFIPGPPASSGNGGLESYAAVAVPVKLGNTGTRAFCADSTGMIRFTRLGVPETVNGLCAESAEALF